MRSRSASILGWPMVSVRAWIWRLMFDSATLSRSIRVSMADRAPRQRFDDPGADAADADHANMRRAKTCQRTLTVEAADAAETALEVDIVCRRPA